MKCREGNLIIWEISEYLGR